MILYKVKRGSPLFIYYDDDNIIIMSKGLKRIFICRYSRKNEESVNFLRVDMIS